MKKLLFFLTLAIPAFATRYDCTWAGGGAAGVWTDPANWASCNGTYPNNGGGHTYSAAPAAGVTISSGITIGHSISNWAVTIPTGSPAIVTCVSASCPFTNGMIVEYTKQFNVGQPSIYPTGASAMARYCVDNVSGSPPQFNLKPENCGASAINTTTSPAGTYYMREYQPALLVVSPGSVTVDSGGDLRMQGDMRIANPNASRDVVVINGGGRIIYDASLSTNPTLTAYAHFQPAATFTQGSRFRMNGSAGNLAILTSDLTNGAQPASKFLNGSYDSTYNGDMFLDYADVSCMGLSSGTASNQRYFWNNVATGSISVKNSIFHACPGGTTVGPIYWATQANGAATNQYVFEDSLWLDGANGCSGFVISTSNAPTGAGLRSFKRSVHTCRFGDSNFPAMRGGEFEYNVFINVAPAINTGSTNAWAYNRYALYINSDVDAAAGIGQSGIGGGVASINHLMLYHRVGGNIRGIYPGSGTADDQVIEYVYAQSAQGAGVSDGDVFMSSTGGTKATVRNFIIAPVWNASGGPKSSGGLGTGGLTIRPYWIQNGTWYNCVGRTSQGTVTPCNVTVAEGANGVAGMIPNFQGNLIYGDTSYSPNSNFMGGSGTPPMGAFRNIVANTYTASGMDFNGCFIVGGTCSGSTVYGTQNASAAPPWDNSPGIPLYQGGTYYDAPQTVAVPGTNDMNGVNPAYVAHRRTMEQYVVARGGTGNIAGVTTYWTGLQASQLENELTGAFHYLFYGWTPFNIRYAMPSSTANGKYLGAVRPTLFFGTF